MAGLLVFAVLGGYVLISVLIVYRVLRAAPQKKLVAGILAAIVVTLPVTTMFWEYVQTKRTFEKYCREEAKVTIFKTVEQWKKENPGVAETLKPYNDKNRPEKRPDVKHEQNEENLISEYLNSRFVWVLNKKNLKVNNVFMHTSEIIDIKTGAVMARMVDFSSGYGNPFLGTPYGLKSYKVWLSNDKCFSYDRNRNLFFENIDLFNNIGGK